MNRQHRSHDFHGREPQGLLGGKKVARDREALPLLRREGTLGSGPDPFSAAIHRGSQKRFATFSQVAAPAAQGSAAPNATVTDFSQLAASLGVLRGSSGLTVPDPQRLIGEALRAGGAVLSKLLQSAATGNVYHAIVEEPNQQTGQVSTDEILRIVAERTATIFDGRTRFEYALGHIPSALSTAPKPGTPMSQYVSDVAEIARIIPDKAAAIVVYCNGPFCGKSRRLGEELVKAGFTNVRRFQLGTPTWRALVGPMEIEPEGIRYVQRDATAVFLDARSPNEFALGSFPGARNVAVEEIVAAKNDGRLPMDDFNTRVVTVGRDGAQALALAAALAQNGFNNVKFYSGAPSRPRYGPSLTARGF